MSKEPEISVELTVNGEKIEMNEFFHKVTCNVINGILKSLRLEKPPKSAVITLKFK